MLLQYSRNSLPAFPLVLLPADFASRFGGNALQLSVFHHTFRTLLLSIPAPPGPDVRHPRQTHFRFFDFFNLTLVFLSSFHFCQGWGSIQFQNIRGLL